MKLLKNKWIHFSAFLFMCAAFSAGIVCLTIFSIVPAICRDNYINQIDQSFYNYIQNDFFNIILESKNDDKTISTQNYKCVIENGNVSYLPATSGLNLKLTIDYDIQQVVESAMNQAVQNTDKEIRYPEKTHSLTGEPHIKKALTLWDAIGDLPQSDTDEITIYPSDWYKQKGGCSTEV